MGNQGFGANPHPWKQGTPLLELSGQDSGSQVSRPDAFLPETGTPWGGAAESPGARRRRGMGHSSAPGLLTLVLQQGHSRAATQRAVGQRSQDSGEHSKPAPLRGTAYLRLLLLTVSREDTAHHTGSPAEAACRGSRDHSPERVSLEIPSPQPREGL